ncbi:MAG: hypothetical protein WDK96_00195 [Candidatus Paceibacterota bacterium]|jgi:hypothetical protein
MDPEIKALFEENLKVNKENNVILKKMRRSQKRSDYLRLFYWLVIIGITAGAFYFINPFIGKITSILSSGTQIQGAQNLSGNLYDLNKIKDLMNQVKK